jgi:hypothetical protein
MEGATCQRYINRFINKTWEAAGPKVVGAARSSAAFLDNLV